MLRYIIHIGIALLIASSGLVACGETPPDEVLNYAQRDDCIRLNREEIPPTASDPHLGFKNVYACNSSLEDLLSLEDQAPFVYPEGTMILKTSRREHQDYIWLIATAEKLEGRWDWVEYKRNFENEDFLSIPVSQDVCVDCHKKVLDSDLIFTRFQADEP